MSAADIVRHYFEKNYRVVFWPDIGAQKGPIDKGWPDKIYTFADYKDDLRVGLMTGVEVAPGQYATDIDIDWTPGVNIALQFLPATSFVYGRKSKPISHCLYTTSEPLTNYAYKCPITKVTLIEIRGTRADGGIGLQSMVPPSVWANKEGVREPLEFRKSGDPAFVDSPQLLKSRVCLGAIGMLLAMHFGHNGFGHETRLAWAGYLLRAGISVEDLVLMGDAISLHCNNREKTDVRRVVESTAVALSTEGKKVKGGPALAKLLGASIGKKIINEINAWLGRDADFLRSSDGVIFKDSQENIRRAMQLFNIEFSYNTFAEKLLVHDIERNVVTPLDDHIVNNLWLRTDREHKFRPTFVFFEKVLRDVAHDNAFHPVRDYLNSLTWDGVPRIDHWLATYASVVDNTDREASEARTYLQAVSAIVLIAAVRRVRHPGCKYDEMLVLESEQGLNKSSALRSLCPQDEWFSDDLPLNVDAKQIIERTLGKWIIEASDLVGGRKADRDHLKSMLSRQIDGPARLAYAHLPIERPRQFIILGSTNSSEYLADSTGSRRIWPVRVNRFDVAGLLRDRDQLWAEASVREAVGESIRLPEELWGDAGTHQEQRREVDAWEEVLAEHAATLEPASTGRLQVSADALWIVVGVVDIAKRDRLGAKRISEIMQRLGFSRANVREEKQTKTGYVREIAAGEVREVVRKTQEETPF